MALPVIGSDGWGIVLNAHLAGMESLINTLQGEVEALQAGESGGTITTAEISDASPLGRTLITAATAVAMRTAIGAGTSSLVLGTTSTTAKAGDYTPNTLNVVTAAGTTETLPATANFHDLTLNVSSCAITMPATSTPLAITVVLRQDATGNRTATFPASVRWLGTAPVIDPAPSAATVLSFVTVDGGLNWFGSKLGATVTTGPVVNSTYDTGTYDTATYVA